MLTNQLNLNMNYNFKASILTFLITFIFNFFLNLKALETKIFFTIYNLLWAFAVACIITLALGVFTKIISRKNI